MNNLKKVDANLVKKYHQDLVFNYAEYPTKDHWDFKFDGQNYKDALLSWLPNNKDKKIFFYVHIPFCEELCWFCTCSKFITKDYNRVKDYLVYLHKEIDLLFNFLKVFNTFDMQYILLRRKLLGSFISKKILQDWIDYLSKK